MNYHIKPINDSVVHEDSDDCICGPALEMVMNDEGTYSWLITHHSLDGRELYE